MSDRSEHERIDAEIERVDVDGLILYDLQDEADRTGPLTRRAPFDRDGALQVTRVDGEQQPRERPQQRRLARAARPDEQDPLASGDAEVDLPQDRLPSSGRSPGEPADGDGAVRGPAGGVGDQTALRSRTSWPGGKGLSAPASASARVSSHPPMPAMTTPETTMRGR